MYVHEQNIWKRMGFKSHFMMITSLTCMQNVETWHMFKEGSTRCQCLKIWWSKPTWYFKTHEMNQPKAKGTIITSATWYMVKICYFCENVVHACASIVVLDEGKCIVHEQIIEREWHSYRPLLEAYVDMLQWSHSILNLQIWNVPPIKFSTHFSCILHPFSTMVLFSTHVPSKKFDY